MECKTFEEVMDIVVLDPHQLFNNIMVLFLVQNFYPARSFVDIKGRNGR
jgi:hypothetical protein